MNEAKYIWKNGNLIDWQNATTHVLTHSLHYGSSVFEGIRAYETDRGPAIFKAKAHYDRLQASAEAYHFKLPYSSEDLIKATQHLIKENQLKSCYIRPLAYFGYQEMGIIPYKNPIETIIAAWEWGSYLGNEALENGIRCKVSSWQKINQQMLPPQAKSSANYANSILAKKEILDQGYHEAILLNKDGKVAEGPGENIFIIKDGILKTPQKDQDLLDGITAQTILELAQDLGMKVERTILSVDELLNADEFFLTGTAAEVTPVVELNDQQIANGKPGAKTLALQELYFSIVKGQNDKYRHWLTYMDD